jgi:hypothetical protein
MSIIGFIMFLIVAAVCAYIAEMIVPGRVPGGFFTFGWYSFNSRYIRI